MKMYRCLVLFLCFCTVYGENILVYLGSPTQRHHSVYQTICWELARRGHKLTIISALRIEKPPKNIRVIDVSEETAIVHHPEDFNHFKHPISHQLDNFLNKHKELSEAHLLNKKVQDLLEDKTQQFDLVISEALGSLGYSFKTVLNCPLIGLAAFPLQLFLDLEPLHSFQYFLSKSNPHFSINQLDLLIVSSNPILHNVKPLDPSFVEVSGIQIRKAAALPKDLEDVMAKAQNGAVLISLETSSIPPELIALILNELEDLPFVFFFKYGGTITQKIPYNVVIRRWFPEQDLLNHPNLKVMVSQGDLQSIERAIKFKVPLLILPLCLEQPFHAERLKELGVAEIIDFDSFTSEEFQVKLKFMISNQTYKKAMRKLSGVFYDQPLYSLDKAIWWIEYVLRHNGTEYLKGPSKSDYFQKSNIFYILCSGYLLALIVFAFCITFFIKKLKALNSERGCNQDFKKSI